MTNENSTLKKSIDTSKAGQQLGEIEDPLVCKLCGKNDLTILDREEDEVYCHDCNARRTLLDKSRIPEGSLVKTEKYWENRFEQWKKGGDLTEQDLKELQETLYSTYYFDNPGKRRQLLNYAEIMEVEVNDN